MCTEIFLTISWLLVSTPCKKVSIFHFYLLHITIHTIRKIKKDDNFILRSKTIMGLFPFSVFIEKSNFLYIFYFLQKNKKVDIDKNAYNNMHNYERERINDYKTSRFLFLNTFRQPISLHTFLFHKNYHHF